MNDPARTLRSARRPRLSAAPQQVSWSGGEKPSEIFTAAYVPAERWNGWAKPYFSQDECLRLAATQAEFNDSLRFAAGVTDACSEASAMDVFTVCSAYGKY